MQLTLGVYGRRTPPIIVRASDMTRDIVPHELPKHLCGGPIICPTSVKELLAKLALHPYTETGILHGMAV